MVKTDWIKTQSIIEIDGKYYLYETTLQVEINEGIVSGNVDHIGLFEVKKVENDGFK